jgi:hypothetical protein
MLRIGRFAVVAVWLGLLFALVRRQEPAEGRGSPLPAATPSVSTADDTWMGVYMRGEKVGYSHSRMIPTADGYRLVETSVLRLSVLNEVQTVRIAIDASTAPDFAVQSFAFTLDSGLGPLAVHGTVADAALHLRIGDGADASEQSIPLSEPLYLPTSARARLTGDALAPGRSVTLSVFDPSAMQHQPLEMHVLAREPLSLDGTTVDAWKVRERFRGTETLVWLDADGHTLREEGPMDMVVQREDANHAVAAGWGADAFDLMGAIAVPVRVPIHDPRHSTRLIARVDGTGDLQVPNDARQSLRDGILHIELEPATSTYPLPYRDGEWQADLQATPFLQVDHPRIRAMATAILAGETDSRRAAERLRDWVYQELDKRPVASIPNAVQVLETRAGDCNEHAVLFAALARAAGLPARVEAGVVYANGAFLYHAWDAVWLGAGWVTVDPTFDQMPADATHVKLVEGGPETHSALLAVIGKLSIDVLPDDAARGKS